MTKEQLIHRIEEIDTSINKLQSEREEVINRIIEGHCPHKIGQKARYVRVQTKRTGSMFNPKWEKIGEREEILVCVNIRAFEYGGYDDFWYEFRRLKPDGTLTQNFIHVSRNEIEWLDEFYN